MILFRKLRLWWTRGKIEEVQVRLLKARDSICVSGDPEHTNAIIKLVDTYETELQELTWKEVYLAQNRKGWKPIEDKPDDPFQLSEERIAEVAALHDLRQAAREFEDECINNGVDPRTVKMEMPPKSECSESTNEIMEELEEVCGSRFCRMIDEAEENLRRAKENCEKLSDKEAEIDIREVERLIHELVAMVYRINNPIIMVAQGMEEIDMSEIPAKGEISGMTLQDLELAAKQRMAEEDPALHGDLVMLLHRLRDPENHPISLLDLADRAMKGECENVELIARALDRLVDDYRETLSTRQQFEMSERDCLVAMDQERGTVC